jgi:hypothetical protein
MSPRRLLIPIFIIVTASRSVAFAAYGMNLESTDVYHPCGISPDLSNCNIDAYYFSQYMQSRSESVPFTEFQRYGDSLAWDQDMIDEASGGDANYTMDDPAISISMFSGHGKCDDQSGQTCTTGANCGSGVCTRHPGASSGYCMFYVPRKAYTCGSGDIFGHQADLSSGAARFGESPNSGGWAGVGTGGNVNFVMFDISCGVTPGFISNEYWNTFAGAHIISSVMPTEFGSDTLDIADRGIDTGWLFQQNQNSSPSLDWIDTVNYISDGNCNGNGGGLSGCGANISMSVNTNATTAQWANGTESWAQLVNDGYDAKGAGYMAWVYQCNYDCSRYPLTY